MHGDKTQGDDNAILILEFAGGRDAMAEESWTKLGGMDDRAEVYGSGGVAYADLLHGNAIETYSPEATTTRSRKPARPAAGVSRSTRKPGTTAFPRRWPISSIACRTTGPRWSPARMAACVLEVIFAAYESARIGCKVPLPFQTTASKPIDLWKPV